MQYAQRYFPLIVQAGDFLKPVMSEQNTLPPLHAGLALLQSAGVLGDRVLAVLRGPRGVRAARCGAVRLAAGAGAGAEPGMRRIRAVAPFQRL